MYYVYLDYTTKRLIISKEFLLDKYFLITQSFADKELANAFCMGYIHGGVGIKVDNEIEEFKPTKLDNLKIKL